MSSCPVHGCRYNTSHTLRNHRCGKCKKCGHGQTECNNPQKIQQLYSHWDETLPLTQQCNYTTCGDNKKYHTTSAHECVFCQKLHGEQSCPSAPKYNAVDCPVCNSKNFVPKDQKKITGLTDICTVCLTNSVEVYFPNCGHTVVCSDCYAEMTGTDEVTNENDWKHLYDDTKRDEALSILKNMPGKVYCLVSAGLGSVWYIRRRSVNGPLKKFFLHADNCGKYDGAQNDLPLAEKFVTGYSLIKSD